MLNAGEQSGRQIASGMDVCDVSGEKVGTVAHVYREVVDVKTGPFGLGKHLYVPPNAVDSVTEAGVMSNTPSRSSTTSASTPAPIN
jgi:hypothetical protein